MTNIREGFYSQLNQQQFNNRKKITKTPISIRFISIPKKNTGVENPRE